jgi:thiol-disulfide isomerase/thioredoxin
MNKNLVIGGGIAAVVLLALVFAFSGGDPASEGVAFGDVSVVGQPLPKLGAGVEDPALGQPGPVISGVDESGDPVTVGGPGEPRIVIFVAHWCSHCQREVPRVTDYLNNNEVSVQFQSVATGSDATAPNYPPSDWLDLAGWPVETMYDDQSDTAGNAYGLSAFPFWVVLDGDGVVQARFSGELDETQLAAVIEFAGSLEG